MKVSHYTKTDLQPVDMPGSAGCRVRWLIGSADHAPNFAMRQFEVEPGGHTPQHMHDYEHEVYVLGGRGEVLERGAPHAIAAGDVVFIAPNEIHQFLPQHGRPAAAVSLFNPELGDGQIRDGGAGVWSRADVATCHAVRVLSTRRHRPVPLPIVVW
jgi:quercetin dioxygenase-like cupin family protein